MLFVRFAIDAASRRIPTVLFVRFAIDAASRRFSLLKQARVAAGCRLYEWWQRDFCRSKRRRATVGHEIDLRATDSQR